MLEITDNKIPRIGKPIAVMFGSPTCGGCKPAKELLEISVAGLQGRVEARYCNTWENHDLAAELQVRVLPQTILFDTFGRPVHTLLGHPPTTQEFEAILDRLPAISKGEL